MVSLAKKTAQEREDTNYDPEQDETEAGTAKKGQKKKEQPDPGLMMGTNIGDFLQPDGKQVEIELNKVRIDKEKTKGQIRGETSKVTDEAYRVTRTSTRNTPHTPRSLGRPQYVSS